MQTDSLQWHGRVQKGSTVSRALQDLAPLSCVLVTSKNGPVTLSKAGYVLRPGRSYYIRVVLPSLDQPVDRIALVHKPPVISVDPEVCEQGLDGKTVRCLPIRVERNFLFWPRLGTGLECEDLDVVAYFRRGVDRESPRMSLPIVVRPMWFRAAMSMLAGLVLVAGERVLGAALVADSFSPARIGSDLLEQLQRPAFWAWFTAASFLVWMCVTFWQVLKIWHRARQLSSDFHQALPPMACTRAPSRAQES